MKSLKWTGSKGNDVELRARCKIELVNRVVDLDGHVIALDKKERRVNARLELWFDGEQVDTCWDINFWQIIDITGSDLKKVWGLKAAFNAERAAIVEAFLQEVIESGKSEEVKAAEQADKEAAAQAQIETAKEIVEKASKQTRIMPQAEYAKWAKQYNDVVNEGGEGFVPRMVTAEQLAWAKKVLAESYAE